MRRRKYTFAEQIDDVKFMKSWAETRDHIWYPWFANWTFDRAPLRAWHVPPGMDRQIRRHSMKDSANA